MYHNFIETFIIVITVAEQKEKEQSLQREEQEGREGDSGGRQTSGNRCKSHKTQKSSIFH